MKNLILCLTVAIFLAGCVTPRDQLRLDSESAAQADDRSVAFILASMEVDGVKCSSSLTFLGESRRHIQGPFTPKFDLVRNKHSKGELIELVPAKFRPDTYQLFSNDCIRFTGRGLARLFDAKPGDVISLGVIQITKKQKSVYGSGGTIEITSRPFTADELKIFRSKYPALASRMVYRSQKSLKVVRTY